MTNKINQDQHYGWRKIDTLKQAALSYLLSGDSKTILEK